MKFVCAQWGVTSLHYASQNVRNVFVSPPAISMRILKDKKVPPFKKKEKKQEKFIRKKKI